MKRIQIILGHFGSGKTELSVNMALDQADKGRKTALLDLDIANPYFRSRERQAILEEKKIRVIHNSFGYDITEDLPALSAELKAPIEDESYYTIIDVGGNDSGARVVNQLRRYFSKENTDLICVINVNRPETDNVEGCIGHIQRIENEIQMKFTGIANNTHMLRETEVKHVIKGYKICKTLEDKLGVPFLFSTCVEDLIPEVQIFLNEQNSEVPIYKLKLFMRQKWLDR